VFDDDRGRHRVCHLRDPLPRSRFPPFPGLAALELEATRPSRAVISRFRSPEGDAPHEPATRRLPSYRPAMRKSRGPCHA
jgi:hypothetical protein